MRCHTSDWIFPKHEIDRCPPAPPGNCADHPRGSLLLIGITAVGREETVPGTRTALAVCSIEAHDAAQRQTQISEWPRRPGLAHRTDPFEGGYRTEVYLSTKRLNAQRPVAPALSVISRTQKTNGLPSGSLPTSLPIQWAPISFILVPLPRRKLTAAAALFVHDALPTLDIGSSIDISNGMIKDRRPHLTIGYERTSGGVRIAWLSFRFAPVPIVRTGRRTEDRQRCSGSTATDCCW